MYLILISVGYEVNGAYLYLKDRAKAATYMHATPKTSTKRFCDCVGLIYILTSLPSADEVLYESYYLYYRSFILQSCKCASWSSV